MSNSAPPCWRSRRSSCAARSRRDAACPTRTAHARCRRPLCRPRGPPPATRCRARRGLGGSRHWCVGGLRQWRPPRCQTPPTSSADVRPPRWPARVRRPRGTPRAPPRRSTDQYRPPSTTQITPNRRHHHHLARRCADYPVTASKTPGKSPDNTLRVEWDLHAQLRFNAHQSSGRSASSPTCYWRRSPPHAGGAPSSDRSAVCIVTDAASAASEMSASSCTPAEWPA